MVEITIYTADNVPAYTVNDSPFSQCIVCNKDCLNNRPKTAKFLHYDFYACNEHTDAQIKVAIQEKIKYK